MKQQQLEVRTEHSVELMHGKYEKKLEMLAIQSFAFFLERNAVKTEKMPVLLGQS